MAGLLIIEYNNKGGYMRRLLLPHLNNLRDLGDIPISHDKATKEKVLLRSDALIDLDAWEVEYLYDYGLRTIIDMRNDFEVTKRPCTIENDSRFNYVHIPILNREQKDEKASFDQPLFDTYIDILTEFKDKVRDVLREITKHSDMVLFNCSAGKDRTGIIAAIILLLNGVSIYDVLADYEISSTYLTPRTEYIRSLYPNMKMHVMLSLKETLEGTINYIYDNYGSIEDYLLFIGLGPYEISILSKKLR